jgi:hypothetical protein
MMGYS